MKILPQRILHISLVFFCVASYASSHSKEPVVVNSNHANYDHNLGIATYVGNVRMQQGARHLTADTLEIHRDEHNKINLLVATGNPAVLTQSAPDKSGTARAEIIKYYPNTQKLDLCNNASLTQNGDTVTGAKLSYNFGSGELLSEPDPVARTSVTLQSKRVQ